MCRSTSGSYAETMIYPPQETALYPNDSAVPFLGKLFNPRSLVQVLPPLCELAVEIKPTHKLLDNWRIVRPLLVELDCGTAEGLDEVEEVLKDFVEIDRNGEAFRYPETKGGDLLLQETSLISVEVFGEKMAFLARFFEGCCYYAAHLYDAIGNGMPDAREEFALEQEMLDYYGRE